MTTWVCHLPVFELTWMRTYKDALAVKELLSTSRAHLHTNTGTHLHTRDTATHQGDTPTHQGHSYTPGTHAPTHQGHSYTPGTQRHTFTPGTYLHTRDTPTHLHTTPEQCVCELNSVYSVFFGLKIVRVCVNGTVCGVGCVDQKVCVL